VARPARLAPPVRVGSGAPWAPPEEAATEAAGPAARERVQAGAAVPQEWLGQAPEGPRAQVAPREPVDTRAAVARVPAGPSAQAAQRERERVAGAPKAAPGAGR